MKKLLFKITALSFLTFFPFITKAQLSTVYNNSACGLNHVQASVHVTTRSGVFGQWGSGLPATVTISGLPASCYTIEQAYVWSVFSYKAGSPNPPLFTITPPVGPTSGFTGVLAGQAGPKLWGEVGTRTWRADVTSVISGNGVYTITVNTVDDWEVDGFTLFIIYRDNNAAYEGHLIIDDGILTPLIPSNDTTHLMTGFTACANSTYSDAFQIVSDMQQNVPGPFTHILNGVNLTVPRNFWNYDQTTASSVSAGQTSANFGVIPISINDSYALALSGLYYQTTTCITCTPLGITTDVNVIDATCGNANGSTSVNVTGGTPPYSYIWSNGDTIPIAANLSSGIHYVTVEDSNGCIAYGTAAISDAGAPNIAVDSTNVTCNGYANGAINLTVTGGVSPYTYLWSDGSTADSISYLIAGIYEVTVTGADSCVSTASITVNEPDPLSYTLATTDASCLASNGSAAVMVNGGTPPYTYFWPATGGTNSSETGLPAGVYLVAISDTNGCITAASVAVNDSGGSTITIDYLTNVSCGDSLGGSINISVSSGLPPYLYLWSTGDTTEDMSNLATGTYNITVTDANGCIGAESVDIIVNKPLTQPICIVTVDSATGKNLIVWEKSGPIAQMYHIYKEGTQANVYFQVGGVPYDSVSTFLDSLADPRQRSWRYKISCVDTCFNESDLSTVHKTMHLTMNLGLGGVINLIWDHYEGFNFGSYVIYRGCSDTELVVIDTVPANLHSYTDCCPPGCSELFYQVAAVHPTGCSPTFLTLGALGTIDQKKILTYNSAQSNVTNRTIPILGINYQSSIFNYPLKVYPNPYTGKATISYRLDKKSDVSLKVYNILGEKIQAIVDETQNSGKYQYGFSAEDLGYAKGIYLLKLTVDDVVYTKQLVEF